MRKSCGQTGVQSRLACVGKQQLRTTNVFMVLVVVCKYRQFTGLCARFVGLLVHCVFTVFTGVISRLMPTIHTTYKDNDKFILSNFIVIKGATL